MFEKPPVVTVPRPSEAEPTADAPPAIGDAEFAEAHRRLLADEAIQFDLPMFRPPEPVEPPGWLQWLANFLSTDHPVLRGLLWILLGAAALLILWLVARWLWALRYGSSTSSDPALDERLIEEKTARALLSEADALAARGLFSEAAHLLLFRSLEDVEARRPGLLRPALTSRDIAGLPAIPERPRGAFARIAMLVERGLFARRPLAEGDWRDCRAAYEEFAFAEGWRG
ncbi:hypothetical protein [Sphingosinicella terrae]|uniref:hypothetical protein n=1 Tax=Sphingosinicella terrae TaxID=2172047 RepID=UPI002546BAC7|nr:hypothetical protein [Sphingosinicella terrae]